MNKTMQKIKVSAVSYTNTLPFIYGINHSQTVIDQIELSLDVPSTCAIKLIEDKVDIGLIPVAALLDVPNYTILSDYCIGSKGKVTSVFIFSKFSIDQVKTIQLDEQSRTSNNLARILLKYYWKKDIEIVESDADAYVEIGDRTFGKINTEAFSYDLGEYWTKFTGLPFAYAVWTANKEISTQFQHDFNAALKYGLANRREFLKDIPENKNIDIREYLLKSIDYDLTAEKREAIKLFHYYIKELCKADALASTLLI